MRNNTIVSLAIFIILIIVVLVLAVMNRQSESDMEIVAINFNNTELLEKEEYRAYINLDSLSYITDMSLAVLREKIMKHPYVKNVTLEYKADKTVYAEIGEYDVKGLLHLEGDRYFLTSELTLIRVLSNTAKVDYPVITNSSLQKAGVIRKKEHPDIVIAEKIISATQIIDDKYYLRLAEVNLRSGGDIVLTLSGVPAFVLLGKTDLIEKLVYFYSFMEDQSFDLALAANSMYIDLRYKNNIYIGYESTDHKETGS